MQVVHIKDVFVTQVVKCPDIFDQEFSIKCLRCSLHQDLHAALCDWEGCKHDNHCKQVGTNRVNAPCLRPNVDDSSRDDDSDRHDTVTKHMEHRCINIDVTALLRSFVFRPAVLLIRRDDLVLRSLRLRFLHCHKSDLFIDTSRTDLKLVLSGSLMVTLSRIVSVMMMGILCVVFVVMMIMCVIVLFIVSVAMAAPVSMVMVITT